MRRLRRFVRLAPKYIVDLVLAIVVVGAVIGECWIMWTMFTYPFPYPYPTNDESIKLSIYHAELVSWNVSADLSAGSETLRKLHITLGNAGSSAQNVSFVWIYTSTQPKNLKVAPEKFGAKDDAVFEQSVNTAGEICVQIKCKRQSTIQMVITYYAKGAFETGTLLLPYGRISYQLELSSAPIRVPPTAVRLSFSRHLETSVYPSSRVVESYHQGLVRIVELQPRSCPEHIVVEVRRDPSPIIQLTFAVLSASALLSAASRVYQWMNSRFIKSVIQSLSIVLFLGFLTLFFVAFYMSVASR